MERTFGTTESGPDSYLHFRQASQQEGEKLSDFLRGLETLVNVVVQKKGLLPSQADTARLDQLVRWSPESEHLRLRKEGEASGVELQLLKEIHGEEEQEAASHALIPPRREIPPHSRSSEVTSLSQLVKS